MRRALGSGMRQWVAGLGIGMLACSSFVACGDDDAGKSGSAGAAAGPDAGGARRAGDPAAGTGGSAPDGCVLTLDILMHGSLRECPRKEADLSCPDHLDGIEFQSTCGNAHLYAWGQDGRITCAYDATTGELVGGVLDGLPFDWNSVSDHCSDGAVGPGLTCPQPSDPWCRGVGGQGNVGGAGGAAGSDSGGAPAITGGAGSGGAN